MRSLHAQLAVFICLLFASASPVSAQACWEDLFPITEQHLLEPDDRWPTWEELEDSTRTMVLVSLGFVDTSGAALGRVDAYRIASCDVKDGHTVTAYYLNGHVDEHDDYVYLTSERDGTIISRVLVGQLQTSCDFTFLRACIVGSPGTLTIAQLEHRFNCETQEFVDTRSLPSLTVHLDSDGVFHEAVVEPPSTPIDE